MESELIKTYFSASQISLLLTGGTGATAQSYILQKAMESIGIKEDFDTKEMRHGRAVQIDAFQFAVLPAYPSAKWHDDFIEINQYCGASPDFLIGNVPGDVKCNYYIDTFISQINNPPKKYLQQIQMQLLATNGDMGILCFYLTKPEVWGEEEWLEYPFPLEKRYRIFEIEKDVEMQELILAKVEQAEPLKQDVINMLLAAKVIELEDYFNQCFEGVKYRALKEASSIYNLKEVFRVGDKFYYIAK